MFRTARSILVEVPSSESIRVEVSTQHKVSGYKTNTHGLKIKMRKKLLLANTIRVPFPCKQLHFYVAGRDDGVVMAVLSSPAAEVKKYL